MNVDPFRLFRALPRRSTQRDIVARCRLTSIPARLTRMAEGQSVSKSDRIAQARLLTGTIGLPLIVVAGETAGSPGRPGTFMIIKTPACSVQRSNARSSTARHSTGHSTTTRRIVLHASGVALLLTTMPRRGWADQAVDYPKRPVTIILPFAPGSAGDGMARLCAQVLTQHLGQSFVVENIGGASGTIGTARVARAAPDGYMLVVASDATITVDPFLLKHMPYDPLKDLVPIATMGDSPMVVAVPAASPIHTLAELVAAAKARPDKLSFGSGGVGSAAHIAGEVFQWKTGTRFVHVPYRGVAASVPDLIAGRLDVLFVSYPSVEPAARGGSVRVLAVASAARSPLVPGVPTAAEAGVDGYVRSTWSGLMGPAGLPQPIVTKLNSVVNAILTDPDVVKRLAGMGIAPIPSSPVQFHQRIVDEWAEMEQLTKVAKITAD